MCNVRIIFLLFIVAGLTFVTTGCRGRTRGTGPDGISPIATMHGDDIFGMGLGERFDGDEDFIAGQFEPVLFAFDSAQINPSERHKLEAVASHLRRNSGARLIIDGHTDERGSREYNLSLGERRALAARAYLVGLGIDGSRLQTRSFGAERPAVMGHNEEAWRQNRRAEFLISR